jgi:hypothetical protein
LIGRIEIKTGEPILARPFCCATRLEAILVRLPAANALAIWHIVTIGDTPP